MPDAQEIQRRLDAVRTEMRQNGMWEVTKPPPEAFADMGPFGSKTMSFDQWLRFVFVPRLEGLLASDGPWPAKSQVATKAVRELDGLPNIDDLVGRLKELDDMFTGG